MFPKLRITSKGWLLATHNRNLATEFTLPPGQVVQKVENTSRFF
jgi:hypothetical protein